MRFWITIFPKFNILFNNLHQILYFLVIWIILMRFWIIIYCFSHNNYTTLKQRESV
jgi:threonine/homoserine/homoserine lactone efflux protein